MHDALKPVDRDSLLSAARRLIESLRDRFVARVCELGGSRIIVMEFLEDRFGAWRDELSRAPGDLLEKAVLAAILDEALAAAMANSRILSVQLGTELTDQMLRDFRAALDLDRLADVRGRDLEVWLGDALRLPSLEPGAPTVSDEELRAMVVAMTGDERQARTELDLSSLAALRDLSPLRELPGLRELSIGPSQTLEDVSALADLPELEVLQLIAPNVTDLSPLRRLTKLRKLCVGSGASDLGWMSGAAQCIEELDIDRCPRIADLGALVHCTKLRVLALSTDRIVDWSPLERMPALRELRVEGTELPDLSPVAALVQLTALSIHHLPIASLEFVTRLRGLRRLEVVGAELVDVSAVAGMPELEELILTFAGVFDLSPVADLPKLREVRAMGADVSSLPDVATLPSLEVIDLTKGQLAKLDGIEAAGALRVLCFGTATISDLSPLSGLTSLEELSIEDGFDEDCPITDLAPLRGLKRLRSLAVVGAPLRSLGPLGELKALEQVRLSWTEIEGIEPLATLPELRAVDVEHCDRLVSVRPLAACRKLESLKCADCERLKGPTTLQQLRALPPPGAGRTYPSAGIVPPRAGALGVVDVRGNLPRTPPEGWSVPQIAPDMGNLCSIDAEGVRLVVGLRAQGDTGELLVAMRMHRGERPADKLAARILRRFRQCSPFTEVEPDEERLARYVTDGTQSVRVFTSRAHPASPDTWAAVRQSGPRLVVEPGDGENPPELLAGGSDVEEHMPSPVPDGWRVEAPPDAEDRVRRILTPAGQIIVMLDRAEGSDAVKLAVGVFPPQDGHYVTDDRARTVLAGFRRRGAFEERDYGPFAAAPGMRIFLAPTHR